MNERASKKEWDRMFADLGYDVDAAKGTVSRDGEKVDILRRNTTRAEIIKERSEDALYD